MKTNFSIVLLIALLFATVPRKKNISEEDYIFSTLVSKKGKIEFEKYYNGRPKDSLCDIPILNKRNYEHTRWNSNR